MKPIGSEKIQNLDEKLNRIREIAGVNTTRENQTFGKQSNILHEAIASDGTEYGIVQEEKHVYLKVKKNGVYDYITGVENIREYSYKYYADALKHLNLIFKQINENTNTKENINLFKKKI